MKKSKPHKELLTLDSLWVDFRNTEVYNPESWKIHNYCVGSGLWVQNQYSQDEIRQTFVEAFLQSKLLKSVKKV